MRRGKKQTQKSTHLKYKQYYKKQVVLRGSHELERQGKRRK
jgi:hypothetical protein